MNVSSMNSVFASDYLRHHAQAFLKQTGFYQRLKSSCVRDFYWSIASPQLLADRAKEVEFYRTTLAGFQQGDVIFDIGANDGSKTDVFLRLGAKVVAVEPDETNQEVLNGKFLKNGVIRKPVTIEGKAVSDRVGTTTLWIEAPGSALNTLNPKWVNTLQNSKDRFGSCLNFAGEKQVETTTLETLMADHGVPFYIKIDVEGHEHGVLRGLKCPVPFLSFEVNLPEFKEEGLECIDLLHEIDSEGEFNYAADCHQGLVLERWMPREEFVRAFELCNQSAIEIFWRTPKRFQHAKSDIQDDEIHSNHFRAQ
ncbi:MAG: FkbM family methyltransferase [Limisphaerales bacterium]